MSVLVYTEIGKSKVKKASLEAVNYAAQIASQMNVSATAIVFNADAEQLAEIGKAGAKKILSVKGEQYKTQDGYFGNFSRANAIHPQTDKQRNRNRHRNGKRSPRTFAQRIHNCKPKPGKRNNNDE